MFRTMLKSKIHRASVTDANLEYEGSLTIDSHLMELAEIAPHELVHVANVSSGERLETYVIPAEPHSGTICANGAAARRIHKWDTIIIMSYVQVPEEAVEGWQPKMIAVDSSNRPLGEVRLAEGD
ncbi:MAG: aspartate 1-decarboxylase [Actinobacteria bacterium]|nr:MAG: aspartate 1-decarboxylase [Actinomycetota bacterium]